MSEGGRTVPALRQASSIGGCVQIRELQIENFRGITRLAWRPRGHLIAIIGSGDSRKSTILDALEAAMSSRWFQFTDADFPQCDTSKPLEIRVTVGDLPTEAVRDKRFGLHLRGWTTSGELRDEPADDDEEVVTVRLTVDASLEPAWELVTDRSEPRTLSQRDRALFGIARVGGDIERHLTWGQGSALSRLTSADDDAKAVLSNAYRTARSLVAEGAIAELRSVAKAVHEEAIAMGAYAASEYGPGLDAHRAALSVGTLALHDDKTPLRLSGLGTRRLAGLAIQRMSIPDGAIVLVDEVEHGLEPHRLRHFLRAIRPPSREDGSASGQVFLTTHSAVTVVELSAGDLAIARPASTEVTLRTPSEELQDVVRKAPEAFLARSIIVCEGKTEVGLLRTMKAAWQSRHDDVPIEHHGVTLIDGGGSCAPRVATELAKLGYRTLLFRDSDRALSTQESRDAARAAVKVVEWEGSSATEERVLADVSLKGVQRILDLAFVLRGRETVLDTVSARLEVRPRLPPSFSDWKATGKSRAELRHAIGATAKQTGWFKNIEFGERLGEIVAEELGAGLDAPIARALAEAEAWAYDAG